MPSRIAAAAWCFTALGLGAGLAARAQPDEPRAEARSTRPQPREAAKVEAGAKPAMPEIPQEKLVTTHHRMTIGGREIAYTATAGTLLQKEEEGKVKASMFFVAYTRDGVRDLGRRPITFTYNGGPGAASVWLHMGAFGPRRVAFDDEGIASAPPYHLADNGDSLLDVTDLVFIDPVTTGYSRPAPGEDPRQFHGVREDVTSVGEFIRLYTTRFGRWPSPKFLAGESYGTTRSAGLARYLQQRLGMYLNGVVLVSSILNFATASFDVGNDLPYPLFLPTYTAAAWYHKRLPADLQGNFHHALEEAERFALGEYTLALARGSELPEGEHKEVAAKLARLTGLSPAYVEQVNLRPEIGAFVKELLRSERLTIGRLDTRFTGRDRTARGERFEYDPAQAAIAGPFTATFNAYVSGELGWKSDLNYETLTDRVRPWSFDEYSNRYLNVAEDLRFAMAQNPALRIFVANGYYDLATPFFATRYTFDHLGFEPGYGARVTLAYYDAGHMMYIRRADREQLKADVARFITTNSGAGAAEP
ncbi:MAG TPA: peptidase S10 [Thermoanaerobaculia bacterium]|nr:peptidase S10 [Thermoanaerobaculia bacterium]